jgi:hypothetical protein
MTQKTLKLALEALAVRFSEGWHEGIKIDASDIMLLNEAAQALAQPEQEPIYQYQMANNSWIDQTKESHDYNVRHGQATVRVVHTAPPQPKQEPVAWELGVVNGVVTRRPIAPPQRTWVGLTDDEMEATFIECGGKWNGDFWKIEDADFHPFLRTIEAKLKERNT